jgi:hypothetical protein
MPHDEHCRVCGALLFDKEVVELRRENTHLRTLLVEVLRAMKEVELVLRAALDKDKKQS